MSKRIAVVTTGGTIEGAVDTLIAGQTIVSGSRSHLLSEIDRIRSKKNLLIEEVCSPLETMSEDMAPTDWLIIIQTINNLISRGCKSIVVTHGTDTMAYTAAAIALYFNKHASDVKICLTGSFYVIDHPESDAPINLEAALEAVVSRELPPGVYVAFKSGPTVVNIYHGLEVSPMGHNSKTFCAMYGKAAAAYVNGQIRNIQSRHINLRAACNLPSIDKLRAVGQKIYQITSYPGLDLSIFSVRSEKRLIIMDSYHSGTAASSAIIDFRGNNPEIQIALSCFSTRYVKTPYRSTRDLIKAGVNVYTDIGSLHLYVLAACRYAADVPFDDLLAPVSAYLLTGRNGELHGQ